MSPTWGSVVLIVRAGYAAIGCTIFVASIPAYLKRVAFAVRFAHKDPRPCENCGEEHAHTKSSALIYIALELVRLIINAVGWFFFIADGLLDTLEGRDGDDD